MNEARALDDIPVAHHFAGGIYAKEAHIPAGYVLVQHKHKYEHLSILASGSAIVARENESQQYEGPAVLTIAAGAHHSVTALTDCAWYCVHATSSMNDIDDVLILPADMDEMRRMAGMR